MKKILPLIALLTTVAFAAPSFATEDSDGAPAAATKEVHKAGHGKKHGKAHHKGNKAGGHHKGNKQGHHAKSNNEGSMMQSRPVAQNNGTLAPTKVWMPSMTHGYQH